MKIQRVQILHEFTGALIRFLLSLVILAECAYQSPVVPVEFGVGVML
jgi:hypothetical protein